MLSLVRRTFLAGPRPPARFRNLALICALAPLVIASESQASGAGAPKEPAKATLSECDPANFAQDRAAHPVFVAWFPASWCPTCAKQREVLTKLVAHGVAGNPYICAYDYDDAEDLEESLGVTRQSVMIRYAEGKETSRSTGETKEDRLRQFLEGK